MSGSRGSTWRRTKAVVCTRTAAPSAARRRASRLEEVPATARAIRALAGRLLADGVELVVMEATTITGGSGCATRRTAVSPAQRARTGGGVCGSDGLPEPERVKGTAACQETGSRAQASGAVCRETRAIWRKLDCLKPSLQKVQTPRPPERRLKPAPAPAAGWADTCGNPPGRRSDALSGH